MKSFILGFIMMLTALWGGAYFMDAFTMEQWQRFPAFVTAFFLFLGGIGVSASKCLDK